MNSHKNAKGANETVSPAAYHNILDFSARVLATLGVEQPTEVTTVGQDFGSLIWNAEFDMLAPGMTESSITGEIG